MCLIFCSRPNKLSAAALLPVALDQDPEVKNGVVANEYEQNSCYHEGLTLSLVG